MDPELYKDRTSSAICILLLDRIRLVREALTKALTSHFPQGTVLATSDPGEGSRLAVEHQPDCILLDPEIAPGSGTEFSQQLKRSAPGAHIIVLCDQEPLDVRLSLFLAGASSFVARDQLSIDRVVSIVESVQLGSVAMIDRTVLEQARSALLSRLRPMPHRPIITLSSRERALLSALLNTPSRSDIGRLLGYERTTIIRMVGRLKEKLGAQTDFELGVLAERLGLLPYDDAMHAST